MGHELKSKDWVQHLESQFANVIHGEPAIQIKMKSVWSDQYRFDRINKDCWADELFCRRYERYWAERGFEFIEDLSQRSQEGDGVPATGLGIDDNSGKIVDFATRLSP